MVGAIPEPAAASTLRRRSSVGFIPVHWLPQIAWGRAPVMNNDLALRIILATRVIFTVRFVVLRCLASVILVDFFVAALNSTPTSLCEAATRIVMSCVASSFAMRCASLRPLATMVF